MTRTWILHTKEGNKRITETDAINEAMRQEKEGLKPRYQWRDDKELSKGWLVWSTWDDGAGVVCKRPDGKYYVITGWQSDFVFA